MSNTARKNEAASEPAQVKWRGHTFEVSRDYGEWSVDLVESLEEGKAVGVVRGALGPDHWRTVKTMNLTMSELGELSEEIAKAMGFGSTGESPASSD